MPRFSAPIVPMISLVSLVGLVASGCGGGAAAAPPAASTAAAAATRPTMDLTLSGGIGAGSYATDKNSTLNICTKAADGSWRLLYAGGTPFVNLDLLVGPDAAKPEGASKVAAEINAGSGYVRFDPSQMRGGDRKGRSTATVSVAPGAGTTTFTVKAKTPSMTDNETVTMDVGLTVTCPNPA